MLIFYAGGLQIRQNDSCHFASIAWQAVMAIIL